MLKTAKIRSYAPVLNLVISELNGYPVGLKYYRKCYQSFTHKLHSERLPKNQRKYSYKIKEIMIDYFQSQKRQILKLCYLRQQQDAFLVHQKRVCQTYRATYFRNKCIFYNKEVKYVKRKREFLRKRVAEQQRVKYYSMQKKYYNMQKKRMSSI